MVCILQPRQDLVLTVNTFEPETAPLYNSVSIHSTVRLQNVDITTDKGMKLSGFATSCYRIMLNIKRLENV